MFLIPSWSIKKTRFSFLIFIFSFVLLSLFLVVTTRFTYIIGLNETQKFFIVTSIFESTSSK